MKIACGSCLLRPFGAADAESLAHHGNDHDVWRNLRDRFPHPYTLADAESYLAHFASHPVLTSFAIVIDDKAIGGISLRLGDDIARQSAEVAYWIGREFWGRGMMVDAVRAATGHAFDALGLVRVFALPFATTTRSVRVLEKAGYVLEGVMRQSAVKEGVLLDQFLYAAYSDCPLR